MNDPSLDRDPFEGVAESFLARYRAGERPSIAEYAARHPELADQIRRLLPALVMVEQDLSVDADSDAEPPARAAIGGGSRRVGDYRILGEIGRGGMGVVYEAEQVSLGRRVALKVLPRHFAQDPRALERFRREAKAAARLHHTNIVPVFEVGQDGETAYYAMQFIQGRGLDQIVDELRRLREPGRKADTDGPAGLGSLEAPATATRPSADSASIRQRRELTRAAELILSGRVMTEGPGSPATGPPAATGLTNTERLDPDATGDVGPGAARGDVPPACPAPDPPASAVLPGGQQVSELDASGRRQPFYRSVAQIGRQAVQGLAYAHARGIVHRDIKPSNLLLDTSGVVWITDFGLAKAKTEDDGLTATGDILGTLRYMAPERFRGDGDARADIYALGLTLYELLTLKPAYDSNDRLRLIERVKNEEPVRPRSLDGRIPRDLETVVIKAIDKDPDRRYPTADALAEDLRRFLADEPILARKVSTTERCWRWARRNPTIASLGCVIAALLAAVTIGSMLTAARFAGVAEDAKNSAVAERGARLEADRERKSAEAARAAAQAETYRAMLSEVRALRAGHQLGWRDEALANLARLAVMPTSRRDLGELRTEAVASLGEFGVKEVARLAGSRGWNWTVAFGPDSRTLLTASSGKRCLDLWNVVDRRHLRQEAALTQHPDAWAGGQLAQFLPDGGVAFLDAEGGVSFLDAKGGRSSRPPIARAGVKAVGLTSDPRGRWLAVGWGDGRVDLHDAVTGAPLRRHAGGGDLAFAISPDGRRLASQKSSGLVEVVPTSGEGQAITLPLRGGFRHVLAFSPDGSTLAGEDDRAVAIWDLASRRELLRLSGHKEIITSIAFSSDGSLVATTCRDTLTRIWDARDGRPLASLPGPLHMQALAFSPDGAYLAAASSGGLTCLYKLEGLRLQRRLAGHRFGVLRLVFHPTLPRLVSSSDDNAVVVWDLDSARARMRWQAHELYVTGLAISPDGARIATTSGGGRLEDGSIRLWDAESGTLEKMLPASMRGGGALAFDPTNRRIASGDKGGTAMVFDVETGRVVRREDLGGSVINSLGFLDEGRSLLVGQDHGEVLRLDLDRSDPPRRVSLPNGCTRLLVDRRGGRAIVGDSRGSLVALSLPDLAVIHRLDSGHEGAIPGLALSPDGRLLATAGNDRRVVLRDPSTFQALITFPEWTGPLRDVAFDATGRWLAFAGPDSEIGLWDLRLVHDELAAVGLAWDQPAPRVASAADLASAGGHTRPPVPVIRPASTRPSSR